VTTVKLALIVAAFLVYCIVLVALCVMLPRHFLFGALVAAPFWGVLACVILAAGIASEGQQ